jgi:hypothetical protein
MKDYRKSAEALLAGQGLGADEGEASPGGDMYGDLGAAPVVPIEDEPPPRLIADAPIPLSSPKAASSSGTAPTGSGSCLSSANPR